MTVNNTADEPEAESPAPGDGSFVGEAKVLRGTPVSSGIARGVAYVLACTKTKAAARRVVDASAVDAELARFDAALGRAETELLAIKKSVSETIGADEADIFAAQVLVLEDASFHKQVATLVRDKHVNVEAALAEVIEGYTRTFESIPDAYLRERAADIRDVGRRVLAALIEEQGSDTLDIPDGAIVVADELLPSVTARLELGRVRAFVTARGGKFSHTSILARSIGMPAVAGIPEAGRGIRTGDALIVDGVAGVVFVNPVAHVEQEYQRFDTALRADKDKLRALVSLPTETRDGTRIGLLANVNKLADAEIALLYNADGIGLYRTEFGFSIRRAFPTEDEQFEILNRAAERLHPRKLVFRLLDVGGDKDLPYFPLPASRNPSLAQRGIRLLLNHPEVLKRQLRAFLRVSGTHPVSILVPVVSGLEEIRRTRKILRETQDELAAEGQQFDREIPLGAMIELPSAALIARSLAREVDFFSLGTNDLVQYTVGADREDETVASYYQPLHPAVLQLIRLVADAARDANRTLTICGDMAGDPLHTELLLGLGLHELSVAPGEMLDVKKRIRNTTLSDARELARAALELGSATEIEALLTERDGARRAALSLAAGTRGDGASSAAGADGTAALDAAATTPS